MSNQSSPTHSPKPAAERYVAAATGQDTIHAMRKRSGSIDHTSTLVCFFYLLLRNTLSAGAVETLALEAEGVRGVKVNYTNGWLAAYAIDLVARLAEPCDESESDAPDEITRLRTELTTLREAAVGVLTRSHQTVNTINGVRLHTVSQPDLDRLREAIGKVTI